jgi:hypothetical protein
MIRKFLPASCFIIFCFLSTAAFSQHIAVAGQEGIGTTMDKNGIWFTTNMSVTNSQTFAKDFDMYSIHPILDHGKMFAYGTEYSAKGTRLLFEDWVKGTVIKNTGEEINGDKYFFNFDKITNNLLVTIDKQEIIEVYKDSIQAFTFKSQGEQYIFKKVPSIQRYKFVQVLIDDNDNYSVYKSINTRFVGADYNTNGLTESGRPYDEYVDASKYYIVYKGEIRPVDLKFPSIKRALKENSSRVKDFYADHLLDEVNENYLTSVVKFLNE